ncbi:hypothetical protein ABW20_dc0101174 [Dactylellina cionopaga]|nr:hypothetical protein ABW20_dc0101174 [Dactylellina cionopaga]
MKELEESSSIAFHENDNSELLEAPGIDLESTISEEVGTAVGQEDLDSETNTAHATKELISEPADIKSETSEHKMSPKIDFTDPTEPEAPSSEKNPSLNTDSSWPAMEDFGKQATSDVQSEPPISVGVESRESLIDEEQSILARLSDIERELELLREKQALIKRLKDITAQKALFKPSPLSLLD